MSILKTIYLQHLNGAAPNATLDANGNMTVTGTVVSSSPTGGMRNRIINGDMRIDQRKAGASVSVDGAEVYTLDRWKAIDGSDGVFSVQQDSSAPAGFNNSLKVTVTTADASIGATQYAMIRQTIEGFNFADFGFGTANAQTVTISFWVRSSLTGTFGGCLWNSNGGSPRCYPYTYTISSANTWEQKSVTIVGDQSGTWIGATSGASAVVDFMLAMGSTYSGPAGAWTGSLYLSPTGATQVISTNGATFYITGVQLEAGTIATPFERRLFGAELSLCQRYCWVNGGVAGQQYAVHGMGYIYGSTGATITIFPPVEMRDVPSLSSSGSFRIYDGGSAFAATVPASLNTSNSTRRVFVLEPSASGMTQYRPCNLSSNNDATAKLILSAEL